MKRRVFINNMIVPALMAGTGTVGTSVAVAQAKGSMERTRLAENGPMIPPMPAILLTVNGKPGDPSEISVVWTFIIDGQPPQIGISVADAHVAGDLIKLHQEFVLNVPTADIISHFDKVDMNSSEVGDKYALSGLTSGTAVEVKAPTVAEAAIHVECRVFDTVRVPPRRTVFFADVVATTVLDNVVDEDGRLLVSQVPFFGMTAGSGEFYTMGEKVGYIGKSIGLTGVKY